MSITILQQPLDYTPTNAQHAYTASSTLSGSTDFRYIFDVWTNPRTGPERVARLLVSPNTYGVGIVDVGDIVKNYIKANPRDDGAQSTGVGAINLLAGTPNGLLINAARATSNYQGITSVASNAFNTNTNYEELIHVGEYKVLIGEQYTDASGTTIQTICDTPWIVPSTLYFTESEELAAYSGTPNTINVFDASLNQTSWALGSAGWSFTHYTTGNVLVASGTTTASTGSYIASLEPAVGDVLTIIENASLKRWNFQWNVEPGVSGWLLVSISIPPCSDQPDFITIWPGVQENKTNFNYNNYYWTGNTNGQDNFKYYESEKYRFYINTEISDEKPAQFLTTFGDELYSASITNGTTFTDVGRVRRRHHHPDCPVLLSYFYRDFNDDAFTYSGNPFLQFYNYSTSWDGVYTAGTITARGSIGTTTTEPRWRIAYDILRSNIDYGYKLASWKITGSGGGAFVNGRISEVVEYYFLDANCLSDPIHFLFLNQRGVWDTWTFDRKNIKTFTKENSVYGQAPIRNSPVYNPFFYSQRDIIYDQTITEEVVAQSNFMEENDRVIVEELFKSTMVYLIKDYISPVNPQPQYSLTPYLIPIVITNTALEEYKQRYNKLYQYTLTFRYNPLQLHRSNL
jgi:hypothetical protein